MISHFMCAVAVPPVVPGEHPKVFHSFCKVQDIYLAEAKGEAPLNEKALQ